MPNLWQRFCYQKLLADYGKMTSTVSMKIYVKCLKKKDDLENEVKSLIYHIQILTNEFDKQNTNLVELKENFQVLVQSNELLKEVNATLKDKSEKLFLENQILLEQLNYASEENKFAVLGAITFSQALEEESISHNQQMLQNQEECNLLRSMIEENRIVETSLRQEIVKLKERSKQLQLDNRSLTSIVSDINEEKLKTDFEDRIEKLNKSFKNKLEEADARRKSLLMKLYMANKQLHDLKQKDALLQKQILTWKNSSEKLMLENKNLLKKLHNKIHQKQLAIFDLGLQTELFEKKSYRFETQMKKKFQKRSKEFFNRIRKSLLAKWKMYEEQNFEFRYHLVAEAKKWKANFKKAKNQINNLKTENLLLQKEASKMVYKDTGNFLATKYNTLL